MAAIDPEILLAETKCYACFGMSFADLFKLGLLNEILANTPGYTVYRALISQEGTAAPVATVLENSLGSNGVWTRLSQGIYNLTIVGAFPVGKTWLGTCQPSDDFAFVGINRQSDNVVQLLTDNDNFAHPISIEILVYP